MSKLTGVKAVLADKARLAKWKANPGLRKQLPEKYLTPEQRLARRMGREIFPGAGITGFEQARQAKTATDQVYGPQKLALQDERNTMLATQQRNAGWWDQYQNQLRAMQAPQANMTQAPDVGAQYGAPAGAVTQGVQQGAGSQQQALSQLAAGLLQSQVASAAARKLEDLAGTNAQLQQLAQKKTALEKEAGLYKQGKKDEIQSAAWKQLIEAKAFGVNAADKKDDNERDAKKWAGTVNKYGVTNGAWVDWGKTASGKAKRAKAIADYNASKGGKGSDPTTKMAPDGIHTMAVWLAASPAQRLKWKREAAAKGGGKSEFLSTKDQSKFWQKVTQGLALWGTPIKNKDGISTGGKYDAKTLQQAGLTLEQVRIINSLRVNKGGLSRRDVDTLHQAGIQLKGRYKVVKK